MAIWKSRNNNSINDQDVASCEAKETLKGLIQEMIRTSWNAMHLLEGSKRRITQHTLQLLWAQGNLAHFHPMKDPTTDFT